MKVPYFIVKQKNEEFFVMRFNALELKDKLDFHFREPYSQSEKEKMTCEKYVEQLRKKGLEISGEQEGVQRRVQLSRINKISSFLEGEKDSLFPNSVVLSSDVSKKDLFMKNVLENPDIPSIGEMDIPDDVSFQIVDGQHRLAGLFVSNESIQENFEIFAVVLFNATKHTCAKIFRDINGNQATVNKSGLFDLLDLVDVSCSEEDLKIEKNIHFLCKTFNENEKSPLYQHIKMMGIGSGAISQAFFVKCVKRALNDSGLNIADEKNIQSIYNKLFYYFSAFQRVFPFDWPVISRKQFEAGILDDKFIAENIEIMNSDLYEIARDKYSKFILKEKKSQLLKTNGFGAILRIFPDIEKNVEGQAFNDYLCIIKRLTDRIDWSHDEDMTSGTGEKIINIIADKLKDCLHI